MTTSKGVESLDAVDGRHVLVAEEPDEFADAVRRLGDPAVRAEITGARLLVADRYSWAAAQPASSVPSTGWSRSDLSRPAGQDSRGDRDDPADGWSSGDMSDATVWVVCRPQVMR